MKINKILHIPIGIEYIKMKLVFGNLLVVLVTLLALIHHQVNSFPQGTGNETLSRSARGACAPRREGCWGSSFSSNTWCWRSCNKKDDWCYTGPKGKEEEAKVCRSKDDCDTCWPCASKCSTI